MRIEQDISKLIRDVTVEANKLIRENELRIKQTENPASETRSQVPWRDFENAATEKLGSNDFGWKKEFEKQIGLKEGKLKTFNQKGMVPIGYLYLCDTLKPAPKTKMPKVAWTKEEVEGLKAAHAATRGRAPETRRFDILMTMQEQFGHIRDYTAGDGVLTGALRRAGLSLRD